MVRRAIAAACCAALLGGCSHDEIVRRRTAIEAAWTSLESAVTQQRDLIGSLLEATRDHAHDERDAHLAVANARARMTASASREDRMAASASLSATAQRLVAAAATHPDLHDDPQFARLTDRMNAMEKRLAAERLRYNNAARAYNELIGSFPHVIYAAAAGFKPVAYSADAP